MIEMLLTKNLAYRPGLTHTPRGIMIHSTGANNPNLSRYIPNDPAGLIGANRYGNHWDQPEPGGRRVCPHAFVGLLADGRTVEVVQTLPWEMPGWHSGKGKADSANDMGYIGIEICEASLTDAEYFGQMYPVLVNLCADLCRQYAIDPLASGSLICHAEGHHMGIASNHADVLHWFPIHGKTMDDLRRDVARALSDDGADWSAEARSWAATSGLFAGDDDGYRWRDPVSREELACVLHTFYKMVKAPG